MVVIAGGMFAAELGRLAGVRIPVVPMSHEYIVTQPFRERDPANPLPTLRDPDLLIYFREEGGGLIMGGYERPAAPAFLPDGERGFDAIPPDFNGRLLEDDWDRFEEIVENSRRRVPQMEDVKVTRMINGPEAFTPDNEFCLGETEIGGLFVAAGFCAHGLAGAGGIGKVMARVDRRGRAGPRPLAHGRPPLRRAVPLAVLHARARARDLRDLLRHPLPQPRALGRPAAADVAGQRAGTASTTRRSARSPAGSGSTGTSRTRATATSRCARAAGPGSTGRRRSAPSTAPAARASRCSTSRSFAKLEIEGPGAAALLERLCDNRVAREPGKITYTQMLNARGGIECDFTVARLARGALLDRHRHRVRQPRPRVDPPPPARRRLGDRARRDLGLGLLRRLGPARARHARAADAGRPLERGVPVHVAAGADGRRRAGARAAGDLRRRARLGAVLPDRVRAGAVAGAVGGGRASTASWPAATARSTRCGSRRATASGAPTSRPTRRRTRAASASA